MREELERGPVTGSEAGAHPTGRQWSADEPAGGPDHDGVTMAVPHYHDTDCSEFLLRIYEYMDGEMGPEENLRFEAHVKECRPCLQQHRVDQAVKGLIRRVAPATVAPETLRASIIARITTFRMETPG